MVALLLAFIFPFCLVYRGLSAYFPAFPERLPSFILKASVAMALGLGLSSLSSFICLVLFDGTTRDLLSLDAMALALLILILLAKLPPPPDFDLMHAPCSLSPMTRPLRFLKMGFWIILVLAAAIFILDYLYSPHGGFDAWAIWNMRARFLFRAVEHWRDAFSESLFWSHPDYPLLIPMTIYRFWSYLGHESTLAPLLTAVVFTFSTVLLLFASLTLLRSRSQGTLAALALLGTTSFLHLGAEQVADVPLSFFFLMTLVSFAFNDAVNSDTQSLATLAGVGSALASWTKNEGLLFLIAVLAARFMTVVPRKGWACYTREILSFSFGCLPILTVIIFFKTSLAPPNDLLAAQGFGITLERLTDFSRYLIITKWLASTSVRLTSALSILLPLSILALGFIGNMRHRTAVLSSMLTLGIMLLGYFFVYVTIPGDLSWYLLASLERLLIHIYPASLFLLLLALRTPEEVLAAAKLPSNTPRRRSVSARVTILTVALMLFSLWANIQDLSSGLMNNCKTGQQANVIWADRKLGDISSSLPTTGHISYVTDDETNWRRYYMAQYALAPLILSRDRTKTIAVGDFSNAFVAREWTQKQGYQTLKQSRDGSALVLIFSSLDR